MRLTVAERVASQHELLTEWSLEDVWDAHEILDAREVLAVKASEQGKPKSRHGR